MTTNHRQQNNPGCFGSLLSLLGIRAAEPKKSDDLPADSDVLPYRLRDDFLSPAEKSFYHILRAWAGDRYAVCSKVSLADLFFVSRPNENRSAHNRINRKHVDFVICDIHTVTPLFAVELDDRSHTRADRVERDDFVDDVFETVGLALIHVPVRAGYNTNELTELFNKTLNQQEGASTNENTAVMDTAQDQPIENDPTQTNGAPFCPKCGDRMVLRTARTGDQAGRQFYGCPNYPRCRVILPKVPSKS